MRSEHAVDNDQQEPNRQDEDQAAYHQQDFFLQNSALDVRWGIWESFAVQARLPLRTTVVAARFLGEDRATLPEFESIHHRTELLAGPGDPAFSAHVRLWSREGGLLPTIWLWGGATLPLGSIEPDPFALGRLGFRHQHVFFGTGTVDPVGGASLSYRFSSWRMGAHGSFRSSLVENSFGFRGSSQLNLGVFAESGFGLSAWTFRLQPALYLEAPARWEGRRAKNSGRADLRLLAGVFWRPWQRAEVYFLTQLTPYTYALEDQLWAPVTLLLGATWEVPLHRSTR